MRPLRAVIDKRARFCNGALFSAPCERVGGLAFRRSGSAAFASIGLAVGFRLHRRRTRGVQHHTLRPFMIRVDPDVNLAIERNVRRWSNRCREAPVRGKERHEQKASHPAKVLKQRHGRSLNASERIAIRGGRPR